MRVAAFVHVRDKDGVVSVFGPGDTIPTWAEPQITNPKLIGTAPEELSGSAATSVSVPLPAKGGKGSGLDKWQAYATFHGFEFETDATRDDIIHALDSEGIATE